jgi:ceramide synthetase
MAGIDWLFRVLVICLIPLFYLVIQWCIVESSRAGDGRQQWGDFTITLYAAIAMSVVRIIWRKVAYQAAIDWILKEKYTGDVRSMKAEKFASTTFKGAYFLCAAAFGFRQILAADYAPPALGGSGSTKYLWLDWENQTVTEEQKLYHLISLAYHVQSLVFHLFQTRNDFVEMLLHHLTTILLCVFSYMSNYIRFAHLVYFTHDVGDIFIYGAKIFVDTPLKVPTVACYVGMLVSCGYLRLYILPFFLIWTAAYESQLGGVGDSGRYIGCGLLCFLQVLHCYWYVLFINMGIKLVSTGKAEDLQHKTRKGQLAGKEKKKA